jgi:hypothetical protein
VTIPRTRKYVRLETLLAELFLVVRPQILSESSELPVLEPLEIVGAIAGLRELVQHYVQELMPVVLVNARGERRELLVDTGVEAAGHRIEELADLAHGESLRAGTGNHRRRKRGKPFLARRIIGGAGVENELHRYLREL